MEGEITPEIGMDNRITVLPRIHRIDGLHTAVEAENQEVQVETDSQSVCHRQLLVETVELKQELPYG